MSTANRFLGIMTGTSLDGVDVALLDIFEDSPPTLVQFIELPYPTHLRARVETLLDTAPTVSLDLLMTVHRSLGEGYARAALEALAQWQIRADTITAIGCHGQTLWHQPSETPGFSLQLGCGATIAAMTGITTVTDFRSGDIAAGGEGAPLAPAFHAMLAGPRTAVTAFLNLGGIANITLVPPGQDPAGILGFDVGPANTLLDTWCLRHQGTRFDAGGNWARTGAPDELLLRYMLSDPYFGRPAPKSTGREYFNLAWVDRFLAHQKPIKPADVQATLVELTAKTVADCVARLGGEAQMYVCGGGARNSFLIERIRSLISIPLWSTSELGICPDAMEAAAFAWLASRRLEGKPSNLPTVTGANHSVPLGAIYLPPIS